jgi:hypothetical protein
LLLDLLADETEEVTSREDACLALCRAFGRDWEGLPSRGGYLDLKSPVVSEVIEEARRSIED